MLCLIAALIDRQVAEERLDPSNFLKGFTGILLVV